MSTKKRKASKSVKPVKAKISDTLSLVEKKCRMKKAKLILNRLTQLLNNNCVNLAVNVSMNKHITYYDIRIVDKRPF